MTRGSRRAASARARASGPRWASNAYVTERHLSAFLAVVYGRNPNVRLWSCLINGVPGAAIVAVAPESNAKPTVEPLFVAVNHTMELSFGPGVKTLKR